MRVKLPRITVRGSFTAVSVDDLIFQLRAEPEDYPDPSVQRSALEACIVAASDWVESYTGHTMVDATVVLNLDAFPAACIELPVYPVRSLESVEYLSVGSSVAHALADIDADFLAIRPRLRSLAGWPVADERFNAVTVTVKAGYEAAADIPQNLKAAVLMLAAHLHENAAAASPVKLDEIPFGVRSLANAHKVAWI